MASLLWLLPLAAIFSPKCQKFAPSLPSGIYLLKCHLLRKPFPGTWAQIKGPPHLLFLAPASFSSINTYYHLISCIYYLLILFIISVLPYCKLQKARNLSVFLIVITPASRILFITKEGIQKLIKELMNTWLNMITNSMNRQRKVSHTPFVTKETEADTG